MTCPKLLRNGPCGGVRPNGGCEVDATMDCVWVKAVERAKRTPYADELARRNPSVDWRLEGKASWVTFALGLDYGPLAGSRVPGVAPHRERGP